MSPAAVSFFARIPELAQDAVKTALEKVRLEHGAPADSQPDRIHFLSVVVLPPTDQATDPDAWLSIEATVDGRAEEAAAAVAAKLHGPLADVFGAMGAPTGSTAELAAWVDAHRVRFGSALGAPQGVAFDGTPGMPLARIRFEARLAEQVRARLQGIGAAGSALDRLREVRAFVLADPELKDALFSEPTQLLEPARSNRSLILPLLGAAVRDHLWALVLLPLLAVLLAIAFGPYWSPLAAFGLKPPSVPVLAWAAAATLAAIAFVERVRLGQASLVWLLLAASVLGALLALATALPTLAQAAFLTPEVVPTLRTLVSGFGLAFGVGAVLAAPLRARTRAGALIALALLTWWATAERVALVLQVVGLAVSLLLALLLLAGWLRASATRLKAGLRRANLIGLAVLGAHLVHQPQALPWVALLALAALLLELTVLAAVAAVGYRRLREQEEADRPLDREPERERMAQILRHENQHLVVQNHLAAQSIVKPGWHRMGLLRLALWTIGHVVAARSPAGFLGRIGTIHHARWVLLPGTRRLVFLSNYDGSWQSYLEDFIARLRQGLSSIWSNTEGFPRTRRLTSGGAADGSGFKRWARRQQVPSVVWFSGYPGLTTAAIRRHAAIRDGLASATTEREAQRWLTHLGMGVPQELARDEITSLVFGGLKGFPYAALVALRFGDVDAARTWLRELSLASPTPAAAYGSLPSSVNRAVVIGLSYLGLRALDGGDTSPGMWQTAFTQGMAHPDRARMLGDFDLPGALHGASGDDEPTVHPMFRRWGKTHDPDGCEHAVLLLYTRTEVELTAWLDDIATAPHSTVQVLHKQRMEPAAQTADGSRCPHAPRARSVLDAKDGISQPILRGLEDPTKPPDPIHLVEPGEIVLGYRDNLRQLPTVPGDGRRDDLVNGTFLVVRQLQFDRCGFDQYLQEQATRLLSSPSTPSQSLALQDWLQAKMLGRWPSGVSLVREPHADRPGAAPDNDFLYGREDPAGVRCPLGAHVRRMNPRDSLDPGSKVQLAVSNRHRILRVSRRYRSPRPHHAARAVEGLMFMCLNADIERQFEFLQQTWALGAGFHGLDGEVDPLLGPGGSRHGFTIPGEAGTVHLSQVPRFVRLVGGGYFFLPGKAYLERLLGNERQPPEAPDGPG